MAGLVSLDQFLAAQKRLANVAIRTRLHHVQPEHLRHAGFGELPFALYLKDESEQPIGSFKLRGAYNCAAQLPPEALRRGMITYSSGNHAQAVAYSARALGGKAVIVMPENAPLVKRQATAALGAEIVLVGPASSERRAKAEELAAEHGYTIIPPYDHPDIIAGQGTCGLEILEQMGEDMRDTLILSPVSGGGLLGGIAAAVKQASPSGARVSVWGAEPELAADAKESFETGTLVEWSAERTARTLCDGLRTQSLGDLNFSHIRRYVDGIAPVTEEEIRLAMRAILVMTGLISEPSGAVAMAAALFRHTELPPHRTVVTVMSGGNIDLEMRRTLEAATGHRASATPQFAV